MINPIHEQGFTLVEVMVAFTIGLFLTAGVTQVFLTTNKTNRTQENVSRMQENARFAMHFLIKDIRQAGYNSLFCGDNDVLNNAYNHLDSSAAAYDFSDLSEQAVDGDDNVGANGSDLIRISGLASMRAGLDVQSMMTAATAKLKVTADSSLPEYGIVLVTDCSYSDIFQITNDPSTNVSASYDELKHGSGTVPADEGPGNKTQALTTKYGIGAKVYFLAEGSAGVQPVVYDIQNDSKGVPGLRLDGDQLVANIENMQILYGERLAGGNMYYVPAGTAGLDMTKVVSVKVSLLVRSPDDNVVTEPQTYFFNDTSTVATDNRLRKVYTSTITVRNQLN